jgi:glycosyltransferase involved in cell wall biosynthesis
MRVALDGIPFDQELTGVGHYTLELARALAVASPADEYKIVSPLTFVPQVSDNCTPTNLQFVHVRTGAITRHWWTVGLPRYVRKGAFDLFHGTNFEVPLWKKCATVLTVHDLSLFLHPESHEKSRVRRARRRQPLMARAANMIITPGQSVRHEVADRFQIPLDKIVAIPEAARSVFHPMSPAGTIETRSRLNIADDFILYVGTLEPRKNLVRLVQAFIDSAPKRKRGLQLVLAGKEGWLTQDLFDLVRQSGMSQSIKFTGYLCDKDLCALYSSCRAFIYPSLYEGFGLPPLEAMACGAPVITSQIHSIHEVTGDAAMLVDPEDTSDLGAKINQLVENEAGRRELSLAGLKRAGEFSWERTAQLTRDVYTEAVNRFAKQS